MSPATFTAVAECPNCSFWDIHRIRPPRTAAPEDRAAYSRALAEWERLENNERTTIKAFGGSTVRVVYRVIPPKPIADESEFEVIRICRCGYEWGMA